ncbi:MAG: Fur family transcriptional regulator [Candidatus Thermoplasmatota archaeon]
MPPHNSAVNARVGLLRARGLKVTAQRLAVLDALMSAHGHPSSEEVHTRLKRKHPTISLSTVYSTLTAFTEVGIVDVLTLADGITRYDTNTEPHANFVCLRCKAIIDLESPNVAGFLEEVRALTPYEVVGQKLEVFGYCDKCRGRAPRGRSKA